jgi:hypothetical protein
VDHLFQYLQTKGSLQLFPVRLLLAQLLQQDQQLRLLITQPLQVMVDRQLLLIPLRQAQAVLLEP